MSTSAARRSSETFLMSTTSPCLVATSDITSLAHDCGYSIARRSNGSHICPSISRRTTDGARSSNSKPIRRSDSISTERCSGPRPRSVISSPSKLSICSAWLTMSSLRSVLRSLIICAVALPSASLPAHDALFLVSTKVYVGSSGGVYGCACTLSLLHTLPPILSGRRESSGGLSAIQMMSPTWASGTSSWCTPRYALTSLTRASTCSSPSTTLTTSPTLTDPWKTRPMATWCSPFAVSSTSATSILNGSSSDFCFGGGTLSNMAWKSGFMSPPLTGVSLKYPLRPLP
mmetsp:Transcript_6579/g.20655  ORF Transcript_6579/g.20655 Transcript_6579/m.20655 type:complete len:288 (-) Transcript_6579:25-888(-)